jgi:hypothetical protein
MTTADPHGYDRLYRSMEFIAKECRLAGDDDAAAKVVGALGFESGSASEFLGEARIALLAVAQSQSVGVATRAFAGALAAAAQEGFNRVGGG